MSETSHLWYALNHARHLLRVRVYGVKSIVDDPWRDAVDVDTRLGVRLSERPGCAEAVTRMNKWY